MKKADFRFDAENHRYYINGRPVPSVTQVLADVLPGWQATEWYLQRGQAVHACAALIAQGKAFEHDPRIAGQVAACRKFFAEAKPDVLAVERQVYSPAYQYAGTADLVANVDGRLCVVDYKASLTGREPFQCAAYGLACTPVPVLWGLGVQLNKNGSYAESQFYDLRPFQREWLALLAAYNIRKRFGVEAKEETDGRDSNG